MFDLSVALWEFRFLHSCGLPVQLYRKMGFEGLHDSCSHVCFYLSSIDRFRLLVCFHRDDGSEDY